MNRFRTSGIALLSKRTDVRIEIVDGRGDVTLLRDVLITWE